MALRRGGGRGEGERGRRTDAAAQNVSGGWQRAKSEARRSKPERRPSSEIRRPKPEAEGDSGFGLRVSAFLRPLPPPRGQNEAPKSVGATFRTIPNGNSPLIVTHFCLDVLGPLLYLPVASQIAQSTTCCGRRLSRNFPTAAFWPNACKCTFVKKHLCPNSCPVFYSPR